MEQASWPGHERTKDLVKDQSPGSAGNPGYLTTTPLRRLPCACHNKLLRMPRVSTAFAGSLPHLRMTPFHLLQINREARAAATALGSLNPYRFSEQGSR